MVPAISLVACLWPTVFTSDRGHSLNGLCRVGVSQGFVTGTFHKLLAREDVYKTPYLIFCILVLFQSQHGDEKIEHWLGNLGDILLGNVQHGLHTVQQLGVALSL